MSNLASNGASRGRPHERARTVVAPADVIADGAYQLANAAEGSAPDALVGDFREEAFHQIQPRSPGGREVPVITGMRPKPGLHRRMGVGAIVVQDQMDGQSTGCAALDSPKETQKLLMAMARSEEHTSELQSQSNLVCRLLLAKKKNHAWPIGTPSSPVPATSSPPRGPSRTMCAITTTTYPRSSTAASHLAHYTPQRTAIHPSI